MYLGILVKEFESKCENKINVEEVRNLSYFREIRRSFKKKKKKRYIVPEPMIKDFLKHTSD